MNRDQLQPAIEIIESYLYGPSDELLLRVADNDPSLTADVRSSIQKDDDSLERVNNLVQGGGSSIDPSSDRIVTAPEMPAFISEAIQQRVAATEAQFSEKPVSGQILAIDEIINPDGSPSKNLPYPMAVLLSEVDENNKNVWSGWVVSHETDYCGYWDLILEDSDQPIDPLAGMVQIWNPVHVYIPSTQRILGELIPARMHVVRALAMEFLTVKDEAEIVTPLPGKRLTRSTLQGYSITTGTPLGQTDDDPRWRYTELYTQAAAKAINEPARLAAQMTADTTADTSEGIAISKAMRPGYLERIGQWFSGWRPVPAFGAVIAVFAAALVLSNILIMSKGVIDYSALLDKNYDNYQSMGFSEEVEFTLNPVKTKSLGDILGGKFVQDRDRYHLRLGFYFYITKVNLSESPGWKAWKKTLPNKRLTCENSDKLEQCKNSSTYFSTLGQWSLLTLTACKGAKNRQQDFWKAQADTIEVLKKDPLTRKASKVSQPLRALQNTGKKDLCRLSEKIVFRNM